MMDWAEVFLWSALAVSLVVVVAMPCLAWRDERRRRKRWRLAHQVSAAEDRDDLRLWRQRIREAMRSEHLLR